MSKPVEKDAVALIADAATEPTLDELARRAREVAAMAEPSEADLRDWIKFWRADRAAWGDGRKGGEK